MRALGIWAVGSVIALSGCAASTADDAALSDSSSVEQPTSVASAEAQTSAAPQSVDVVIRETLTGAGPCPESGVSYEQDGFDLDAMNQMGAFLAGMIREVQVVNSRGQRLGSSTYEVDYAASDCTLVAEIPVKLVDGPYTVESMDKQLKTFTESDVRDGVVTIDAAIRISIQ